MSHLVYAGRGNKNRGDDADWTVTRDAMNYLFETAWASLERGETREFVTGNNDADAVLLYKWVSRRFPERAGHLRAKLAQWGGNATGVNVANIDNLGNVHPDTDVVELFTRKHSSEAVFAKSGPMCPTRSWRDSNSARARFRAVAAPARSSIFVAAIRACAPCN